jgi:mRNA interferase YafQ
MRTIERTGAFKRDFKRVRSNPRHRDVEKVFVDVLNLLLEDAVLPPKFHDHLLTGDWTDHRDCHVKPDLVLIYRKPNDRVLQLVRIGSHSELGL